MPFICGSGDKNSFVIAQLRDGDFGERIEETGVDRELKTGVSLEEILKKGPHKFSISIEIKE